MARILIILGSALLALGLAWPVLSKLGLGKLPGDLVVERENFRLYAPLTTSIILSAIASLVLWLLQKL